MKKKGALKMNSFKSFVLIVFLIFTEFGLAQSQEDSLVVQIHTDVFLTYEIRSKRLILRGSENELVNIPIAEKQYKKLYDYINNNKNYFISTDSVYGCTLTYPTNYMIKLGKVKNCIINIGCCEPKLDSLNFLINRMLPKEYIKHCEIVSTIRSHNQDNYFELNKLDRKVLKAIFKSYGMNVKKHEYHYNKYFTGHLFYTCW